MILIADSGSTKTSWCLVNQDGEQRYFDTEGYNPYFVDSTYIKNSLEKSLPLTLDRNKVREVNFYGAGCMAEKKSIIEEAMQFFFNNANIFAEIDTLAAARALLGTHAGFAAILGTGTNTCLYNGKTITHNIDSLGYVLGDEGSGCAIGKKLLADYCRGYMPRNIRERFRSTFQLHPDDIMDHIYSKPLPNRFCAGFSKFITQERLKNDYFHQLVKHCFKAFFFNLVTHYPDYKDYSFNCIGSIGYNFREILSEVSDEFGMKPGYITRSPMPGLFKYHTGHVLQ